MTFIADKDQQTIREHFAANLAGNVEIILFTERQSPLIARLQPCENRRAFGRKVEFINRLDDTDDGRGPAKKLETAVGEHKIIRPGPSFRHLSLGPAHLSD